MPNILWLQPLKCEDLMFFCVLYQQESEVRSRVRLGSKADLFWWEDRRRRRIYGDLRRTEAFVTMRTTQKRQVCILLPNKQHLDCTVKVSGLNVLFVSCLFISAEPNRCLIPNDEQNAVWTQSSQDGPWMHHVPLCTHSCVYVLLYVCFLGESQRPWGVE